MFGRFIKLSPDFAHNAPNYMVQGSAAEIMKLALMATRDLPGVLTVHDELVFEVLENRAELVAQEVSNRMTSVVELSIPLGVEVGVGPTWSDAKK
jgi:DNA polymerase-1